METATKQTKGSSNKVKTTEPLFDGKAWLLFDKGVSRPDPFDTVQLTEDHKATIRRTWDPMKGNLVDSGTRIFVRIFQVGPRIREVFNYMLKDGKELADKDALQMHSLRFMQAIDTAVEDLDDLDRQVAPMFVNLGRRHIHFKGLEEGDFDGFTGAIMYVFSQDIGDDFKPDVRIAWGRLLDFLILHLKFGFVMARKAAVAKEQGGSG